MQEELPQHVLPNSSDPIALARFHYNPSQDVVLRAEFMSERETKVCYASVGHQRVPEITLSGNMLIAQSVSLL